MYINLILINLNWQRVKTSFFGFFLFGLKFVRLHPFYV